MTNEELSMAIDSLGKTLKASGDISNHLTLKMEENLRMMLDEQQIRIPGQQEEATWCIHCDE